jgi:cation diffusion facilitator CzcD-associated flavoprotein CzcO
VLATGRDGLGGNHVPAVAAGLPAELLSHTRDDIDFAALRGKRVAVLGSGASACDNAAEALEAGAAEVHQFIRREHWPRVNKFKNIVYSGFVHGFPRLTVAERLHILTYAFGVGVAPPRESVQRLAGHTGYRCHLGAPWTRAEAAGGTVVIDTPKGRTVVDHVVLGTGFAIDVARVPMLAAVAGDIRRFRDAALAPDWPDAAGDLLDNPELGSAFEFQEKAGRSQPLLADLHCFNQAALLSHGMVAGDIPSVSDGAERLARGIARQFFIADLPQHIAALEAYEEPELLGDEIAAISYE